MSQHHQEKEVTRTRVRGSSRRREGTTLPQDARKVARQIREAWDEAGRCNTSQDAQDAGDAENTALASGRNAGGSDAGSLFADGWNEPDEKDGRRGWRR